MYPVDSLEFRVSSVDSMSVASVALIYLRVLEKSFFEQTKQLILRDGS